MTKFSRIHTTFKMRSTIFPRNVIVQWVQALLQRVNYNLILYHVEVMGKGFWAIDRGDQYLCILNCITKV